MSHEDISESWEELDETKVFSKINFSSTNISLKTL